MSTQSSRAASPTPRPSVEGSRKHSTGSVHKMWKHVKHAVAEHHRSVNAAYQICYGQGFRSTQ
ncbi:hypothetical protein BS50DRAFT_578303 [Corynespora cassiicola Philippines]|uniref:Uncharacterized protein n=1 Tax=Corynespora cassiicola Philippines TaxID=1448308 RepID=A0A2T2N8N2_CORCC|nr:hypothetical protein BS50DRAFT_578303 [Corynespora cassiicola Philippines]